MAHTPRPAVGGAEEVGTACRRHRGMHGMHAGGTRSSAVSHQHAPPLDAGQRTSSDTRAGPPDSRARACVLALLAPQHVLLLHRLGGGAGLNELGHSEPLRPLELRLDLLRDVLHAHQRDAVRRRAAVAPGRDRVRARRGTERREREDTVLVRGERGCRHLGVRVVHSCDGAKTRGVSGARVRQRTWFARPGCGQWHCSVAIGWPM